MGFFLFCFSAHRFTLMQRKFQPATVLSSNLTGLKPSLSMKILSINDFTTKLLSKLLSDLYTGVHLKGTKKFGSKVINRQLFHRKTVFH